MHTVGPHVCLWVSWVFLYILFYRKKSNDTEVPFLCNQIAGVLQEFNQQQKGCDSNWHLFSEDIRGLISLEYTYLYSRSFFKKSDTVSIVSVLSMFMLMVCASQKFWRKWKPVLSEKQTWKRTIFHNAAFPKVFADHLELSCSCEERRCSYLCSFSLCPPIFHSRHGYIRGS